jgi:hypothetical protein
MSEQSALALADHLAGTQPVDGATRMFDGSANFGVGQMGRARARARGTQKVTVLARGHSLLVCERCLEAGADNILVQIPDKFAIARWPRDADVATICRCVLGALKYEPHTADVTVLRRALEAVIGGDR